MGAGWTFPSQGVNVFSHQKHGGWDKAMIVLNAPLYLAYFFADNQLMVDRLKKSFNAYDLTQYQPRMTDKPNNLSFGFI